MRRPGIRVLLPLLASLLPGTSWGAWRPLPPTGEAPRVRLETTMEDAGGARVYTWMAPDDTLRFDILHAGRLRVEVVPVYPGPGVDGYFRYGLRLPGDEETLWKRHSRPGAVGRALAEGASPTALQGALSLGAVDRYEAEAMPGALVLRGRPSPASGLLVRVLRRIPRAAGEPALRARSRGEAGITAGVGLIGWDSNPYLAPSDTSGIDGEFFYPVFVEISGRLRPSPRWRLDARYDYEGWYYGDDILDERRHEFRLDQALRGGDSGTRWRLRLDERLRLRDNTFFGRGESEEFETIADEGLPVNLGDRFDYTEFRVRFRGDVELDGALGFEAEVNRRWRDYTEDFEGLQEVYALDYDALEGVAGLAYRPEGPWEAVLEGRVEERAYDEKFPRDPTGEQVPGGEARVRRTEMDLSVAWTGVAAADLELGVERFRSEDLYAGWWDYDGWRIHLRGDRTWRGGHRVVLRLARKDWSYDIARVGLDPTGELREKGQWSFDADGRWRLRPWLDLRTEIEYDRRQDNDPRFDYSRWTVIGGAVLRF